METKEEMGKRAVKVQQTALRLMAYGCVRVGKNLFRDAGELRRGVWPGEKGSWRWKPVC